MTFYYKLVTLPVFILLVCFCQRAVAERSRAFIVVEGGAQLSVSVRADGTGRTEAVVSLRNASDRTLYFFPTEALGVPSSLELRDEPSKLVPYTAAGQKIFAQASGAARPLKPGERIEKTFLLEEMFALDNVQTSVTLIASRWLVDDKHQWVRLQLVVPDATSSKVPNPGLGVE
jgi:hypothetical protein